MRVINLDETGIKLINDNKNQMYITCDDLVDFVNEYKIVNDKLMFNQKELALSASEIKDFPIIINRLKNQIK